jgi:anti-sigma B factor antagonist
MTDGARYAATTTEPEPRIVVVRLPAEIDLTNTGQVCQALDRAIIGGAVLIADATRTSFCDCAGLSALIRAHRRAAAAGAQLRIAASPTVRRIVELTRADDLLETYPTVTAASGRVS